MRNCSNARSVTDLTIHAADLLAACERSSSRRNLCETRCNSLPRLETGESDARRVHATFTSERGFRCESIRRRCVVCAQPKLRAAARPKQQVALDARRPGRRRECCDGNWKALCRAALHGRATAVPRLQSLHTRRAELRLLACRDKEQPIRPRVDIVSFINYIQDVSDSPLRGQARS